MSFYRWRGLLKSVNALLLLYLLLISFMAMVPIQGREIASFSSFKPKESSETMKVKVRVGSRPPRCERRCGGCGPCEPVQVPAVPLARAAGLAFRGDEDSANYKPVSWKCKCGDIILNP